MRTICCFYSYLYIDLKILTSMYIKGYLTKLEWGGGGYFCNLKYTCSKKSGSIYIHVFKEIRSYLYTRVERN